MKGPTDDWVAHEQTLKHLSESLKMGRIHYKNKKFWKELIRPLSDVSHLFEVLGPNLMEMNLSEITLTSLN
jgi:hypothetical protein